MDRVAETLLSQQKNTPPARKFTAIPHWARSEILPWGQIEFCNPPSPLVLDPTAPVSAILEQRQTKVVMSQRNLGIQLDRSFVRRDCLLDLADRLKRGAEIEV